MNKQITNIYTKTVDEIKAPEKVVKIIIENISKNGTNIAQNKQAYSKSKKPESN